MILALFWINLKSTLITLGAYYLNTSITRNTIILLVLGFMFMSLSYFFDYQMTKWLSKKISFWFFVFIFLFCLLFFISNSFILNIYPGGRELGRFYYPDFWESTKQFKESIGGLYLYDAYNPNEIYFEEGTDIFGQINFNDPNYKYKIYLQKDSDNSQELEDSKNGTAFIVFNVTKAKLYSFEIDVYNDSLKEDKIAVINVYPNVMGDTEVRDRKRDLVIITGSLMAAILLISINVTNYLREMFKK